LLFKTTLSVLRYIVGWITDCCKLSHKHRSASINQDVSVIEKSKVVIQVSQSRTETTPLIGLQKPPKVNDSRAFEIFANIIALIPTLISTLPPVITNATMGTKAAAVLLGDANSGFLDTWKKVIAGNYGEGVLSAALIFSSYVARTPFNAFYVFNSTKNMIYAIRCNKKTCKVEKNVLGLIFKILDEMITFSLIPSGGAAVGKVVQSGLSEMKVPSDWQKVAFAITVVFWGQPLSSALERLFSSEVPRTIHSVRSLVSCKKNSFFATAQNSSVMETRGKLLQTVYNCLDAVSLLNYKELPTDITSSTPVEELLGKLSKLHVPKYKGAFADIVGPALGTYVSYVGTTIFCDLGKQALDYIWNNGKTPAFLSVLAGEGGQFVICAVWTILLKDALFRPLMRWIPSGNPVPYSLLHNATWLQKHTNFISCGELLNNIGAYFFGAALGFTNIALIPVSDPLYIPKMTCMFSTSVATSAAGFNSGRKSVGWMKETIHDKLTKILNNVRQKIETMSDNEIRILANKIIRYQSMDSIISAPPSV